MIIFKTFYLFWKKLVLNCNKILLLSNSQRFDVDTCIRSTRQWKMYDMTLFINDGAPTNLSVVWFRKSNSN